MEPKKVLIITYYWPPSGGSGVQRWVKFCKYLPEFGWEPIIYTPANPEYPAIDNSLEKDIPEGIKILKQPIWEPYAFYKKFTGLSKDEKLGASLMNAGKNSSLKQRLSLWIRGNFFIPDPRRFWIRPSVKFLGKYFESNKVDAVVSTGPPHSMHLIAQKVIQNYNIPWVADFRDPWTNIDFFDDLKLTTTAKKLHHRLEKKVLNHADAILVVSPTMKKEFQETTATPIHVITNGFDSDDFSQQSYVPNKKFIISHLGMMSHSRNPENLWKAIAELKDEESGFIDAFQLHLVGKIDKAVQQSITRHHLNDVVNIIDYVAHTEVVEIEQKSEALLLVINDSPNATLLLTGKLFEYIAAKRPILCITPVHGDVDKVINETEAGKVLLYEDLSGIKNELKLLFHNWKNGVNNSIEFKSDKFSRKYLTQQLSHVLNQLI